MGPTSTSTPTTEGHKSESSAGTTVDSTDDTRQQRTAGAQDVNCYSTFDSSDICYAIESGNAETVQKLVEAGADVNAVTEEGAPIVTIAVSPVNPNPEIMRILIEAGADVNAETEFHGSLLNAAITTLGDNIEASAYIAIVEMLVNAGADVNWTGPYNNPVLAGAVNSGNAEIVRVLVEAGADPSGHGLLRLAFSDERDDYHWEIVRMLVEAGADPNERNTGRRNSTEQGRATGNVEAMSFLVAAGANPNDGPWPHSSLAMRRVCESSLTLEPTPIQAYSESPSSRWPLGRCRNSANPDRGWSGRGGRRRLWGSASH